MARKSQSVNANLAMNLLNQVLGIGFPIIIQFYLIRHFKLEDLGYLSLLNSYWALLLLVLSFFNFYLLKVFAEVKDKVVAKSYLTNSIVIMYSLIVIPIILLLIYLYYKFGFIYEYVLITSLPVIFAPWSMEIYFQATLRNKYIFIRRAITRIILLAVLFIWAREQSDFIIYVYIASCAMLFETLVNLTFLKNYFSLKYVDKQRIKEIFKNSIRYLPFNLTYNILPILAIIVSEYFLTIETLSVYAILIKIVNLATSFITSAVMVLYPMKIKQSVDQSGSEFKDSRYMRNTAIVSVATILVLIALHKLIFFFFVKEYTIPNMLLEFSILSLFILFHSVYNYVTFNYFFYQNKLRFISIMNLLIVMIYALECLGVYLGLLDFHFALFFVSPFPIVLMLLFLKVRKETTARAAM